MDMRLEHQHMALEQPCGRCHSQFTVEGDVTLPGSLRESNNVLHASATAVVESTEALQDRVSIKGRVVFCVLYTQGEAKRVESIEATADFVHLCDIPGAVPRAEMYARAQIEHVEAHVQNGRMTMRAQVRVCARAMNGETLELISRIDVPGIQQRTAAVRHRRTVGKGASDVLLREEFSLPADLAIHETLAAWARADFHDTAGGQGRIGLSGEVQIEVLHASDVPGKPLVMTRHSIPISQSVEITGENGEILNGRILVKDVAVASQDMGDGERTLRAEVLLGLSAWAEREEQTLLLTDAYTTVGDELRLTSIPVTVQTGTHRACAAESGKASLLLPEGAKPLRTVLAAFALPVMSSFVQQGSRLMVEGTLKTTVLYLAGDGEVPQSVRVEAPFRAAFAMSAQPEDMVMLSAGSVEAVPITSDRMELRYILHAEVDGVEAQQVSAVTEAAAVPAAAPSQDIVLYFTQPGEGAWEISRRYRIPEQELKALNPDMNGEPKAGQGVVVWRRSLQS